MTRHKHQLSVAGRTQGLAPASHRGLGVALLAVGCTLLSSGSQAQTVIGSASAGFQNWHASNLNNNRAPFWDAPYTDFGPVSPPTASKNVGFCLTSTGDCQGVASALSAPGAIPFWGMPYDAGADTGGGFDPKVYLKRSGHHELKATLYLSISSYGPTHPNPGLNEFGWFETDAAGSMIGATHLLFKGSSSGPADKIGMTVSFTPTEYFGYYYGDTSEGNCKAYTLSSFNDPGCGPEVPMGVTHNLVIFSENPSDKDAAMWIAGEDPPNCDDGDCNLSLVRISRHGEDHEHH